MKTSLKLLFVILLWTGANRLFAQGTAFSYQGQLYNGGSAANGSFDITFSLFTANSGGTPASPAVTNLATIVSNGLFSATLDFGPGYFNGTSYWLELGVRTNGGNGFTILGPRQAVTPAPYAIFSSTATTAGTVSGTVNSAQLSGAIGNNQLAHSAITVTPGTGLGGGGLVALGGAVTLSNTGVIAVVGNADLTAVTSSGMVTLGDTATSTNTASTIVKRDAGGNFGAGTLTLSGTLNLTNLQYNTGIGAGVLAANTTGNANTAVGFKALNATSTGSNNIALGSLSGSGITTGSSNIDIGNPGLAGDASIIRIGLGQTQTFLVGSLNVNGTKVVDATGNWVGNSTGLVGPQGPAGTNGTNGAAGSPGAQGLQGIPGPAGTNGTGVLSGTAVPASVLGTNGDFYINTSTETIYGPKTAGGWGASVSLIGPQGTAGPAGAPGMAGTNGRSILSGNGTPSLALGTNGDFYLNTNGEAFFGPKTGAGWGGSVSLIGPQGPVGLTGTNGPVGPAGPAGPGSTLASLGIKAGSVTGSVSTAGVANLSVTFVTPFANTNYAINLTPRLYTSGATQISVAVTYTGKATTGFTVNIVAGLATSSPPPITCDWMAIPATNP